MPIDWKYGCINDIAKEVVCGKTPSTKDSTNYGEDIPFITIPDMHNNVYVINTERMLSNKGASTQSKKTLPANSICVSCIGTAGLVSLVSIPSQTNQQINSIIPKDDISPYFVYLMMKTLNETINSFGQSGSTIVNLNKNQFSNLTILIPSVADLKKFHKIVKPLFIKILSNQKENVTLMNIRDTLLPKLMSGEINVSQLDI